MNPETKIDLTGARYYYAVYGLSVASEVALPELTPIAACSPDVSIEIGHVPEFLENTKKDYGWISYGNSSCLIKVEDIARYMVSHGRRITVDRRLDRAREPGVGAALPDLRTFLLGSAFAAILHQRGSLPLHVSAVQSDTGVWAFSGDSGAGKSTIAAWLKEKYDWKLVSDDVSVIHASRGKCVLHSGPRKLKLWDDALERLNYQPHQLVQDLTKTSKFQVYLEDNAMPMPTVLKAIIVLDRASPNAIATVERLSGVEAFNACRLAIYRPFMAHWFRAPESLLHSITELCSLVDVYRYRRQWSLDNMDSELRPLEKLIREVDDCRISSD